MPPVGLTSVSEFEWEPARFLATMLTEIPGYEELQETVADAARGRNVLELGTEADGEEEEGRAHRITSVSCLLYTSIFSAVSVHLPRLPVSWRPSAAR